MGDSLEGIGGERMRKRTLVLVVLALLAGGWWSAEAALRRVKKVEQVQKQHAARVKIKAAIQESRAILNGPDPESLTNLKKRLKNTEIVLWNLIEELREDTKAEE